MVLKLSYFFNRPLVRCTQTQCALALALLCTVMGTGCGKGAKSIPGVERFQAGVVQSHLYVSFVSTALKWDQGLALPIPGLDEATVSVTPDLATSGTVFQFSIGLAALINNEKPLPLSGLPDGRAIPDIQGGTLPRWDSQVRDLTLSIYLSNDAFGFFVPLSLITKKGFSLPATVSVKIEDERGNNLGKGYAIPSNSKGKGSGLFVLLPYLGAEPHPAGNS